MPGGKLRYGQLFPFADATLPDNFISFSGLATALKEQRYILQQRAPLAHILFRSFLSGETRRRSQYLPHRYPGQADVQDELSWYVQSN